MKQISLRGKNCIILRDLQDTSMKFALESEIEVYWMIRYFISQGYSLKNHAGKFGIYVNVY